MTFDTGALTLTGTLTGEGGVDDTLSIGNTANIAGATIGGIENLTLATGGSFTMTVLQHDGFSGTVTAAGSETITFSATGGDTATTGDSAVETYVLGTGGITFTLGTAAQNLTGSGAVDTVSVGTLTATGTLNGNGGTDVLSIGNGGSIAGATVTNFESLTLASDATVTIAASQLAQFSGTITAAGSETVNVTGNGDFSTLANIETFSVGDDTTDTRTITIGHAGASVTATSATDAVTFSVGNLTYTGTLTGNTGVGDTLSLADGANIAGGTIATIGTLDVASGASVTLTETQHDGFTTIAGTGTNQITLSAANGDGAVTGDADIEIYVLGASMNYTLAAAGQSVTGSANADTVNVGTLVLNGSSTLNGNGGTDTLTLGNGGSIAAGSVSNFENLTLANGASVTMTVTQHAQFNAGTTTAAGAETINLTGDGNFTTLANVEAYSVGDDTTNTRTITVGAGGTSVSATSATDAVTFDVGTLTYTGTITGEGTAADTLTLGTGASISGGTISNVANLTLTGGASVTMREAQHDGFSGTITAAGADTITISDTTDGLVGKAGIETYILSTANQFTSNAAGHTVTGSTGNDTLIGAAGADTFSAGAGNDQLTGGGAADLLLGNGGTDTLSGGAGVDTLSGGAGDDALFGGAGNGDVLAGGAGADTFRGSASDFNADEISDFAVGDSIVVTGADLSALNGTAASATITLPGFTVLNLTGITSASGTFAASFAGGNTTITLTAPASGGGGGGGGGSGGSTLVVNDSSTSNTTGGARTITNNGTSSGSAAIVENTGNNGNIVTATLPPSITVSSEGPATAQSGTTAANTLITAIQGRSPIGETGLVSNAQAFLVRLSSTTSLDVRTIVPTLTTGVTTDDPIIITGSTGTGQSEAFVIDMRSITGKTLQVNDIEFVSILGNATVTGGAGDNYATGDDNAQFISLGEGNDTLYGGGGDDTVGSAGGDDSLFGEAGNDTMNGGTGADSLWGGTESDVVYGNQQDDLLYGNQASDTLYGGQDSDTVYGGQDTDLLYGNLADDMLYGNLGADTLYGGQGNDALFGGQGDDLLIGNLGDDTLYGNLGDDTISTGAGSDVIVVGNDGGIDVVADFDGATGDVVQLAANVNGTAIDTFAELQAAAADNASGNVEIALGSGNTLTLNGVTASELQSEWFTFG